MYKLLERYGYRRFMAPEGFGFAGGFGGGGQQVGNNGGGGNGQGQNQSQSNGDGNNGQSGGDDANNGGGDDDAEDDLASIMAAFDDSNDDNTNGENDGKKGNGGGDGEDDDTNALQESLRTTLTEGIKAMRLTDDSIPQDFDPTDRTQLTTAFNSVMQQTAVQTMRLMFKPVQAAMEQMQRGMLAEINSKIKEYSTDVNAANTLENLVPEIKDPELAPMIRMMDKQGRSKGMSAIARAQQIRKALDGLGVGKRNSQNGESGGGKGDGKIRKGMSALDLFAPLPKRN